MPPSSQKYSNEATLYAAALRALVRRAHSVFEMRTYLERRAETQELARHVMTRLKQEKLIDDARYTAEFARSRARFRRQGRYRIARELRARGVPDRHIDAALAQAFAETDERDLIRKIIERRTRGLRGSLDLKKMASLHRTLLRAGFESGLIRRELRAIAMDVPEVVASDEDV